MKNKQVQGAARGEKNRTQRKRRNCIYLWLSQHCVHFECLGGAANV